MRNLLFWSICFFSFQTFLTASELEPCGTKKLPDEMRARLAVHQAKPASEKGPVGGITYTNIQFHLVGTDEGTGHFPASDVFRLLCDLNFQFRNVGMQFVNNGPFNYLNNTNWYDHDYGAGGQMMNANNYDDVINVYIVDSPAGNCGYFTGGPDAVAVAKSCSGDGSTTLAHELGHYFSLPHTFVGWEGAYDDMNNLVDAPGQGSWEKADGSNCASAADGFCDTPADYVSHRWQCPYGPTLEDQDGNEFKPDETLYMSYALDACTYRFSPEQRAAMVDYLFNWRTDLLGVPEPNTEDVADALIYYPASGSENIPADNVLFSWSAAAGATQYYLEAKQTADVFSGTDIAIYTSDTFYVAELDPEVIYYWSIQPFSEGNTCSRRANGSFRTNAQNSIAVSELSVTPPLCNGTNTGSIFLNVDGGASPYGFEWETGEVTQYLNGVLSGIYKVTVTDSDMNATELNINVPEPAEIEAGLLQVDNNSVTIEFIQGGVPPYEISWSSGESNSTAANLEFGENTLMITDANGCVFMQTIDILAIEENVNPIACNNELGSVNLEIVGGVEPYELNWTNGSEDNTIADLTPGTYEVTITDATGFEAVLSYDFTNPAPLSANLTVTQNTVYAEVEGGTPPYNYYWPTGLTPAQAVGNLPNGDFEVLIYDANNCELSETFTVDYTPPVGIEDNITSSILVYPTILKGDSEKQLFISGLQDVESGESTVLKLYNTAGQQIMSKNLNVTDGDVHMLSISSSLSAGTYFIQLSNANFNLSQKLIVIQ